MNLARALERRTPGHGGISKAAAAPCRYNTEEGVRHGLVVKVTKMKIYLILMQHPVHVTKVARSEAEFIETIPLVSQGGTAIGSQRTNDVRRQLRKAARQWGHTLNKETKQYLRNVK